MAVEIQRFAFDDVGKAPRDSGLYAWYGRPAAGPADWADEQSLRTFLAYHTKLYVTPTLTLSAKSTFQRTWSGELAETTSRTFDRALGLRMPEAGGEEPIPERNQERRKILSSAFEKVCASDVLRRQLVEALNDAIPILAGPLYVGITKRPLRRRLSEHRDAFEELHQEQPESERLAELLRDDKNFAARAVSRGFTPERLEVWCMPLVIADVADADAMLPAVEFFLNRWHHPPFGRR